MDNKPPFDRTLFIPIIIGVCSVLGICLVLLVGRLNTARGGVQSAATQTLIKYQYLGTEPAVVFPTDAPTATLPSETIAPTPDVFFPTPVSPTATSRIVSTVPVQTKPINTPVSLTPTFLPLNVTYDDSDIRFLYTGDWRQNGVTGAYQNTLHISSSIGDSVQLSFVGQKIRYTYQAGPSLGAIAIKLDGVDFALDQASTDTTLSEWESPILVLSSHAITITHISGGSINIDSIAVIDLGTATPTP
ncbi:MAG TPA: hypothetical protein VN653_17920 [Anaerolineales bacterium]|nr:hypothetical protein [Anaerolineales bacterium]